MPNQPTIGIPPYIQSNTSGDTFSNNTFDPETGTEMQALNRKQQIANLLVQQSLAPRQGQMVGNVYVPAGWGQGAAQLGQALAGAYMTRRNDKARANLESQSNQNVANAMTAYQESQQGKPALTVPEGSQGPERPEMPATPETQRQGLARLMANQNPAVQRFAQYEAQRQAKQAELKAQQDHALALEAAKAKSALEQKAATSGDALLNAGLHREDRVTISRTDQERIDADNKRAADKLAEDQRQFNGVSGTASYQTEAQQRTAAAERELKKELHGTASGDATLNAQTALTKHNTASADTLTNIDAKAQLQNQELAAKQVALDQQHARELDELNLKRDQFTNLQDFQKAEQGLKERQLSQTADLKKAELTQQANLKAKELAQAAQLHATPTGTALANIDAASQQKTAELTQRQAEFEQKKKQDMAALALEKSKFANQADFNKAKLALEAKHQGEQNLIAQERNKIAQTFHEAQLAKGDKKVDDKREVANYNAGLKEVAQDQKSVEAAAALEDTLKRWVELQDKVETGPIAGRRPISFNPDYQELKSLEDKLGVNNFKPGQGAMSNFERTLIKGAGPSTLNDAATNKNIAQVMMGGLQTMKDRADFKEWYLEQHGKMLGADKQWSEYVEKNPRFTKDQAGNVIPNQQRPDWLSYFSGGQQPAPAAPPSGGPVQTASAAPMPQGTAQSGAPAVGTVKGGYVFKGGNPASPSSWEKQ